jgi:hypothetical protein
VKHRRRPAIGLERRRTWCADHPRAATMATRRR